MTLSVLKHTQLSQLGGLYSTISCSWETLQAKSPLSFFQMTRKGLLGLIRLPMAPASSLLDTNFNPFCFYKREADRLHPSDQKCMLTLTLSRHFYLARSEWDNQTLQTLEEHPSLTVRCHITPWVIIFAFFASKIDICTFFFFLQNSVESYDYCKEAYFIYI